jgi:UDP-N-acetylmuramoyl-L-alanyl-D-glutamate--2,6-diaminopimelate ligase
MGQISGDLSDTVIITSDNPRSEEPVAIIEEIEAGIKSTGAVYQLVPDRRMAIGVAISMAQKGDVVVIAGKGHETYQEFKDKKRVHFDDREVTREFIQKFLK